MTLRLKLRKWYDLHAHFRQGPMMAALIADHLKMGCAGILAMPNTKPPVAKVFRREAADCWSIEEYLDMLFKAGADAFLDVIVPLYLTQNTNAAQIAAGAQSGLLRACKYYPPHGTTNADFGAPLDKFMENGVFKAMQDHEVTLCIHGEEHALPSERYFARGENAEEIFYAGRMPRLLEKFPKLKIVCEHVTTKAAVDFVTKAPANVGATITPQHLIYTAGDLLRGFKYHLYCLPLVKFAEDREALRKAAATSKKFFAGTDSAPHTKKAAPCGCAAGAYTGGIAPQLYAQAFEMAGVDLSDGPGLESFKNFLCENGPAFYGLKSSKEAFALEKAPQEVGVLKTADGDVVPLPVGMQDEINPVTLPWKI